jgi:GNAT superfamily N-acetyltransferase
MDAIDEDPPRDLDELRVAQQQGDLWMACDGNDVPVGFALTDTVDKRLHLHELGVLASWQRQGIGACLIEHLQHVAIQRGMAAVTLTTFREVPWNAPYYARLGFKPLPEDSWGPELTALVAEEESHGLERSQRIVMVLPL